MNIFIRLILLMLLCSAESSFINAMMPEQQENIEQEGWQEEKSDSNKRRRDDSDSNENSRKDARLEAEQEKELCGICFEEMDVSDGGNPLRTLPCKSLNDKAKDHTFHRACINAWLKKDNICATCRTVIPTKIDRFFRAAKLGQHREIELLLDEDDEELDINARDHDGNTALHCAAQHGHTEVVTLLLDRGADINARGRNENTALLSAAESGRTEVVVLLLNREADVKARDYNGFTALHRVAINSNNVELGSLLLDFIKNKLTHEEAIEIINAESLDGIGPARCTTALHNAVIAPQSRLAEKLLEAGADINSTNFAGEAALHLAVRYLRYDSIAMLLRKGADANARNNRGQTALELASALAEELHWFDETMVRIHSIFTEAEQQQPWCAIS